MSASEDDTITEIATNESRRSSSLAKSIKMKNEISMPRHSYVETMSKAPNESAELNQDTNKKSEIQSI